jgi:1-acyl-sn-glycerol-3-phosphate acyltransferase
MNLFKTRIWVGYLVYIIPLAFTWYLTKWAFSWFNSKYTEDQVFNVYLIFVGFVVVSIVTGAVYATLQIKKPKPLRFLLTLIFGVLFVPMFILFLVGGLIITIFPKLSCPVTYLINILTQFMTGMFIIKRGNLGSLNQGNAILALNHRGSGDYSFASTVAGSNHWKVMIGANLWKIWWLRWFFDRVGLKIFREGDRVEERAAAVRDAKNFLLSHKNAKVIIFTEGTRNRDDNIPMLPFKPGAFNLSVDTGIPVIPVVIVGMQHWRRSSIQDKTSFKKEKTKFSFKSIPTNIGKLYHRVFDEGINPMIIMAYYLDPISPAGKTAKELQDEVWQAMNNAYIRYAKNIKPT